MVDEIEINLLSKNNLVPYFELDSKCYDTPFPVERLYLVNDFGNNLISTEDKVEILEQDIGTTIIDILNNYTNILDSICNCKEKLINCENNTNNYDYKDYIIELKSNFLKIDVGLEILSNFINCFYIDIAINYNKELYNIANEIRSCEFFDSKTMKLKKNIENNTIFLQSKSYYENLEKKYKDMSSATEMKNRCIRFFENMEYEFKNMKKLIDEAFVPSSKSEMNNKFSGISLNLPASTINFFDKDVLHPNINTYKYKLNSLSDFFNVSIYHIYQAKKTIKICKNDYCKKYFIPIAKNQQYCSINSVNNNEETCREKTAEEMRLENPKKLSFHFKENLRKRLLKSSNLYGKDISKEFNRQYKEKKQLFENSGYTEEEIETELIKWLTIYDKELQSHSKIKCKTRKYWIE